MAFELSNKSLALLLIAALVVSLGGTLVSLNRLKSLEAASPATGMVTLYSATAGVNVTITSTTAINFTTNYINFGTGNVNGTCGYCNMYSNYTLDSTGSISSCCQGFSGATTGLVIENIGNTNVSIGMNSTNNAVTFIGGTTSPGPQFRMKVTEKEARACWNGTAGGANDGGGLNATWNNTFGDVPTTETEICARLRPDSSMDELRIDINVTIPDNSMTGLRTDTLSATATTVT